MVAFDIICTGVDARNNNLSICKDIMYDQGIKFILSFNKTEAIKRGRGVVNPSNGFVIITPTGEVLVNYIQLFRYLEGRGLIRL